MLSRPARVPSERPVGALGTALGCWYLWLLVPLVAAAAWWLLPVNATLYETFVNPDAQGDEQLRIRYETDAMALYTSGFGVGHLLALTAGFLLIRRAQWLRPGRSVGTDTARTRDEVASGGREAARAGTRTIRTGDVRSAGRHVAATAAVAAAFGTLLGLTALAVAVPAALSRIRRLEPVTGRSGSVSDRWPSPDEFDHLTPTDPAVLLVLVCGLAGFALWAAVGVGLGAWTAARWWPLIVLVGLPLAGLLVHVVQVVPVSTDTSTGVALWLAGLVLIPAAAPWGILEYAGLFPGPAIVGTVLLAGLTAAVLRLGSRAVQRRLADDGTRQVGPPGLTG